MPDRTVMEPACMDNVLLKRARSHGSVVYINLVGVVLGGFEDDVEPVVATYSNFRESSGMVTGPSFVRDTLIIAPNLPSLILVAS